MIAVMGASGNTGGRISQQLLHEGENIRALGRSAAKLAGLESKGAKVLTGDATDAAFLASAFGGADAVYTLLPPDPQSADLRMKWDQQGEAVMTAIRASGVRTRRLLEQRWRRYAGGHWPDCRTPRPGGTPSAASSPVNVLILRPASFFENFYAVLGLIKHQKINGGAVAPDLQMPMIATRDIADVAARALKSRDWTGVVVRELLGPRDLTHQEATRIIGARIGKADLQYVQLPYVDFTASLVRMGISQNVAGLYAEMAQAFNEGKITSREGRRPENTTPTNFEDFAEDLERAYETA